MSREWVDFVAIKQELSIREVLSWHGVAIPGHKLKWRGRCPVHGGEGDQSFHVHLDKNVFHCFACGAGGDVLDLSVALEGGTVREAAARLRDRFGVGHQSRNPFPPHCAKQSKLVTKKISVTSENKPLPFQLDGLARDHPYVAARRIRPETAGLFGIGVYSRRGLMRGRLAIPIHDHLGRLVAYAGRALGPEQPRYLFPAGFHKSSVLYNFHRAAALPGETVIVVEGFLDCMRVCQAGHSNVIALMEVTMSPCQQQLLTGRFRRIILMLDGDDAGRKATREIAVRLCGEARVDTVTLPHGSQPDKVSDQDLNYFLSESSESDRLVTQFP